MSPFELLKGEKVLSHCQSPSEILWIFERLSLLQRQHLCLSQYVSDQGCRSDMSSKIHCIPQMYPFSLKGLAWTLLFGYMKIHWAPKYPEVFNLRLHSSEGFFRIYVLQNLVRTPVLNIYCCHACFCPQNHRKTLIMHHCIRLPQ
jgi:hypothetical protein